LLDSAGHINHEKVDTTILKEWIELRDIMLSGSSGTLSPNKFVYHVQQIAREKNRDIFTGWVQNDITEFLLFMIDCIHNSH
jgi:ubiquitin C-terminal hydrolase